VKKFLVIPVVIVLVTALIFGGCKPAPEAPTEILIGGADTHTGVYSAFTLGGYVGVEAAIADINSLGGIYIEEYGKKLPVKIISTDNESNEIKAATLAEDMILRDKVDCLIQGTSISMLATPVAGVAERHKVPFVTAAGPMEPWYALWEQVTPHWKYTWNTSFSIVTPAPPGSVWDKPGMTLADVLTAYLEMIADQTNGKAGLYATDDPNGRGWYALCPSFLEQEGFSTVGVEEEVGMFPFGTTDYTPMIEEWKDEDIDLLIGNAPGAETGVLLRQANSLGLKPKSIAALQAGMFYRDIAAWGGNLAHGIVTERWWDPSYDPEFCPGIAGRTPQTLVDYWNEKTGEPFNPAIGLGYMTAQLLFDGIERAGTLDKDKINAAFKETDLSTIMYPIVYDETQFGRWPIFMAQWRRTDSPDIWELGVIVSHSDHIPVTAELIFPTPYD